MSTFFINLMCYCKQEVFIVDKSLLIKWASQLAPPNTIYRGYRYTGRIVVYPIDADLDHSLFDL